MERNPNEPIKKKKSYNKYKRSTVVKLSSTVSMLIFLPVFAVLMVFFLLFPKSTGSVDEKRDETQMTKFPELTFGSYFSGDFTRGIQKWFTDTVPYRDDLNRSANSVKNSFGIHSTETVSTNDNLKAAADIPDDVDDEDTNSSTGSTSHTPVKPKTEEEVLSRDYTKEDAKYTVENGIIVVNQDGHYRALEMFGGGSGEAYADALNLLRSKVDSKVNIYSMPIPLASQYYTPKNYTEYSSDQQKFFKSVQKKLSDGIKTVDISSVLAKHTEEQIYCRTDHHWMPLGAYYASQEFASVAGVDFKDISTYEKRTIDGFVGTMYAFTGDINIKNDPEAFNYYVPDNYSECKTDFYDTSFNFDYTGNFFKQVGNPESNAYLTFMGGDEQICKIRTNVKNGRKLVIIKDSFGNAEPGYYMNSFEEIYVIDMRYCSINLVDLIKQKDITDVLFTMCTFSVFGDNADNLRYLVTQNAGNTIVDGYDPNE